MKKRKNRAFLITAAMLVGFALFAVAASAASPVPPHPSAGGGGGRVDCQVEGGTLSLSGLDGAAETVIAACYDHDGKLLCAAETDAQNGSASLTVDTALAGKWKLFQLGSGCRPVAPEDELDLTAVTRVWLAEKLCEFADISFYDPATLPFTDCEGLTDAQKCAVLAMVDRNIVSGAGPDTFAPFGTLTREQAATILYRVAGEANVDGVMLPYSDVESTRWSADAVRYLYSIGTLSGAERFYPTATMLQSEFTAWLECLRERYMPCDLRLTIRDGVGYLDWDVIDEQNDRLQYSVSTKDDDRSQWRHIAGTQRSEITVFELSGTCEGFRVTALLNGLELSIAENTSLKTVATNDPVPKAVASAAFTQLESDPPTYRADVTGVAGYPFVDVWVRNGGMGNIWGCVTGGGNTASTTFMDFNGFVASGEYCIFGYSGYALADSGRTLTYDTCQLSAYAPCGSQPLASGISNIRFDEREPGILLWDFVKGQELADTNFRFRVELKNENGRGYNCGANTSGNTLLTPQAGTYTKIRVFAVDRSTNQEIPGYSAEAALTVTVTEGTTSNTASAVFTNSGGGYDVALSGLSGYKAYQIYVGNNGARGMVDPDGTARAELDRGEVEAPGATYSVYGAKDYAVNGNTLSFTLDCLCRDVPVGVTP